ncbi:MAG: hypothetical protein LBV49_00795 [Azonexus sp.]|nr:hypothetical protein [Azonexus sp.]
MNIDMTTYAISKQIPDMARGFTIATNYGDLVIDSSDAAAFQKIANRLFERKLKKLLKSETRQSRLPQEVAA